MRRAYCQAIPTPGTPFRCDHKFGAGALAFGVMAPLASQRTALEEHDRADPRPVMQSIVHDVKNDSIHNDILA